MTNKKETIKKEIPEYVNTYELDLDKDNDWDKKEKESWWLSLYCDMEQSIKIFGIWGSINNKIHKWSYPLRNAWRVLSYIPFLWSNYDFDSIFALYLLRFKLIKLKENIKSGFANDKHKEMQIKKIDKVIQLIHDYDADEFCKQEQKSFKARYGELKIFTHNRYLHFYYEKAVKGNKIDKKINENAKKESLKIQSLNKSRSDKAWKEIFDILENHMREWWD